ncbi:MAG: hypothetical protein JJT89_07055 [Nitriliruptoraceae bacterium]|nr:hypothetical protein [Nitriliruptoraceae bacterium]
MMELLFLAVEEAIPADHPAAYLAVPLGLLFMSGSVYVLLWSNYGAKKAGAIYGTAFFGFAFLIGVFWWFGGPGIPAGTGISHLPGQTGDHYSDQWYGFEATSPRADFFDIDGIEFQSVEAFAGVPDLDEEELQDEPLFGSLAGQAGTAQSAMQEQFLPVDDNNVAVLGTTRRAAYEEDAVAQEPADAFGRAQPFFGVQTVGDTLLGEDASTGLLIAAQTFQATATFTDEDGIPFDPVPVGDEVTWYAFYDPGAEWIPSMIWSLISLVGFALSLFWLDRLEMRDKRRETVEVEEPERLKVPIAQ